MRHRRPDRPVLTLVCLLLAIPAFADRPPPGEGFPPAYDPCRLAARIGLLYSNTNTTMRLADENVRYRLAARRAFVRRTGEVAGSLRLITNATGISYRLTRHVAIFGKESTEQTDVDAVTLLPLAHERQFQQFVGADRHETILWDHIAGRIYLARYETKDGRMVKQTRARVVRMEDEVPATAMDGLAAMLRFRVSCLARNGIAPLELYLYDGIGSRFAVSVRSAGPVTGSQATAAGESRLAPFGWEWRSLSADGDRRLKGQLALDKLALPVLFTMDLWGVEGRAEMINGSLPRPE